MEETVFTPNHLVAYRLQIEAGPKRKYKPLRKGTPPCLPVSLSTERYAQRCDN